jgi:hypothetical protein
MKWCTTASYESRNAPGIADVEQALSDALALIDAGTAPYLAGNATERRLINLAIYVMLLVSDHDQVQAKPTAFYARLVPTARQLAREAAQNGHRVAQNQGTHPQNGRSPVFRGHGSQNKQMAGSEGRLSKHAPAWERISCTRSVLVERHQRAPDGDGTWSWRQILRASLWSISRWRGTTDRSPCGPAHREWLPP